MPKPLRGVGVYDPVGRVQLAANPEAERRADGRERQVEPEPCHHCSIQRIEISVKG